MKTYLLMLIACILFPGLVNAQTKYITSVDAVGDYDVTGRTFYVESGDPSVSSDDSQFIYYSDCIAKIMARLKAYQVSDPAFADMRVRLKYYIQNTALQGSTGDNHYSAKGPRFYRYIDLEAIDNTRGEADSKVLWTLHAENIGATRELKPVFPYMCEVLRSYIGKTTDYRKVNYVVEGDGDVALLRNELLLRSDVVVNPFNNQQSGMTIRCVQLAASRSCIMLLAAGRKGFKKLKITPNTYIIYKGASYRLEEFKTDSGDGVMGQTLTLKPECTRWVRLDFPVRMERGDSFHLISYKDKDLSQVNFQFIDVTLQ